MREDFPDLKALHVYASGSPAMVYATLDALSVIDPARKDDLAGNRPPIPMPTSVMAMRPAGLGQKISRVMHLRIFEGGRTDGGLAETQPTSPKGC